MMDQNDGEKKPASGCGVLLVLYNTVFRRQTTTTPPSTTTTTSIPHADPIPSSDEASLLVSANPSHLPIKPSNPKPNPNPKSKPLPLQMKPPTYSNPNPNPKSKPPTYSNRARVNSISAELDTMIHDHQRTKGSTALVRASSGNVMVFSQLGNIRAPGAVTPNRAVLDYLPKTAKEIAPDNARPVTRGGEAAAPPAPLVMCRALSRRLDPEELKEMGNEEYKNGNFAEAVALYDRAILMDPEKASYWSNKAAALIGLGHLLQAVGDCREAVRIDPSYCRPHHRLATLYLRLGEAEKAVHHYKLSRNEASSNDIQRAQAVQIHLSKCNEGRKLRDWNTVLKETESAVSSGADSAPQVFASKAEALLMLKRHEEADTSFSSAPKFDIDESTKFFGASSSAYFLAVRAQVDMAAGRFEDAVSVAHRASRFDPGSREVSIVARRARAAALARSRGNDLFKASKFEEACFAYGEGLDHDSHNAILLCNRAACRSKLGQWEKAIEDCSAALNLRPSYSKARLRRADCNAKLGRWEASVQDYDVLLGEMPGDEEVRKALLEAQLQLKKERGDGFDDRKKNPNIVHITTKDQFKYIVMSPGLSVALFFNKQSEVSRSIMPLMEQLCKQYPSVNFLKVDMDEVPPLANSERVSSVPSFRIYKNGSRVEDIAGSNNNQLESSLKMLSS